MFRYLSNSEIEKELNESKYFLENMINKPIYCFAFPYGRLVECSVKNISALKKSDYSFSFSAVPGNLNQSWLSSIHFLPRINIDEKIVNNMCIDNLI